MQSVKIAIITSSFNQPKYLLEAIQSVQTSILAPYPTKNVEIILEHIIWDDASEPTNYQQIVEGIDKIKASMDNIFPIKLMKNEKNGGSSDILNKAIGSLDDDSWVMILDHDDILLQRSVKNWVDQIVQNPDKKWFSADFLQTDQDLRIIGQYYGWQFENPAQMAIAILKDEHFCQQNVCYHKSLWQNQFIKDGGYDLKLKVPNDIDFYLSLLIAENIENNWPKYTSFVNHLHRFHGHNISTGTDEKKHKQDLKMLANKHQTGLIKLLGQSKFEEIMTGFEGF